MEEKFRSNAVQNSPFLEGVATEGRRGSVVRRSQCFFEVIRVLVADTTPPAIAGTPSAEGEYPRTANDTTPALASPQPPIFAKKWGGPEDPIFEVLPDL